jgi:hypothetical protein
MSLSAEFLATLRCGPWFVMGGESGGLSSSGTVCVTLGKLSCCADGDAHGSVDSQPVQAKLADYVLAQPLFFRLRLRLSGSK